jgi:succinate dehydrogenase/fumarate reductase cytochrome b subunit (b558 family)
LSQPESRELSSRERRAFVLRKLHSLTGVVPVGVYLVFHLWTNAKAMQGRAPFDQAVSEIDHLPALPLIEIFAIGLPLLYHAAYGLAITLEARPNVGRYPTNRNWGYLLQRITGVAVFAFLVFHVWTLRVPVAMGTMDKADFFPTLCDTLSSTDPAGIPVMAIVYLLGTAAAVYHFTVGLYGFCFSWGITLSRRAARIWSGVFGVLGLALFVLAANTIIYYATGSSITFELPGRHPGPPALTCRDVDVVEPLATEESPVVPEGEAPR